VEAAVTVTEMLRQRWLDQPVLRAISIGFFLIGAGFWIEARLQDEAFSAAIFGHFALSFRAEFWAGAMMAGAALCYAGLSHPQHRGMIILGGSIMALQFTGLALSAIMTGGSLVVGLHASILFAPGFARLAWEACRDDQ
jgi:hypothetical protein